MHPTRRAFLRISGGAVAGAVLVACGDDGGSSEDAATTTTTRSAGTDATTTTTASTSDDGDGASLTAADFAGLGTCLLLPEQTEGPYYVDDELVRRDITEGLAGHPLRLGLMVVDPTCQPIEGAVVDIWHADVDGDYSGYTDGSTGRGDGDGGRGTVFLRGSQIADAAGIVEFATLYPGWYRGRTVHIHLKVHIGEDTVLTSQLVFDDALSDEVFAEPLYAGRGERDTRNDDDGITRGYEDNGTLLTTRSDGAGTLALVVIGVDPSGSAGGNVLPLP
jgi:protocatechuate 3,4-dioxygenase beta subunit